MSAPSYVQAQLTPDELRLLQLIRTAEPDADFEVHRRDGKIVNVSKTTIHRREFESTKLREPRVSM